LTSVGNDELNSTPFTQSFNYGGPIYTGNSLEPISDGRMPTPPFQDYDQVKFRPYTPIPFHVSPEENDSASVIDSLVVNNMEEAYEDEGLAKHKQGGNEAEELVVYKGRKRPSTSPTSSPGTAREPLILIPETPDPRTVYDLAAFKSPESVPCTMVPETELTQMHVEEHVSDDPMLEHPIEMQQDPRKMAHLSAFTLSQIHADADFLCLNSSQVDKDVLLGMDSVVMEPQKGKNRGNKSSFGRKSRFQ
jgi:hypothetical protein